MFLSHYSLTHSFRIGRMLLKTNNIAILRSTITTTPIRLDVFNVGKRMRKEEYYKKLDKIAPTYELIYRAPFEYLSALCKHVPAFSLTVISAIALYKIASGLGIMRDDEQFVVGPIMSEGTDLMTFFVLFYIVNLSLIYFITKYPLRIYKSKKNYVAMFEGYVPLKPRPYSFQRGDIGPTKSWLPWSESMFRLKDRNVLVFSHHFKKPADFNDMFRK